MSITLCPCGSAKPFADCCEPYLGFKDKPKSVRQLVRARYSAYALGAGTYRDFLVRTWHPATQNRINATDLTNDTFIQWKSLHIVLAEQQGDRGRAEFKATYSEGPGPDKIHHERAIFHRNKGIWYYVEGGVKTEALPQ